LPEVVAVAQTMVVQAAAALTEELEVAVADLLKLDILQ
jgi:hypothetical protein